MESSPLILHRILSSDSSHFPDTSHLPMDALLLRYDNGRPREGEKREPTRRCLEHPLELHGFAGCGALRRAGHLGP
jgi:hypothetical protein